MNFKEDSGGSSKNFLKLKDKESIVGVFRGEPHDFHQHWIGNRSQNCTGQGCALCADKKVKKSFRFRINFVTKEPNDPNVYVPKIFEQSWTVYGQLRDIHKDYNLAKTIVKITRNGTGQDTKYSVLPIPNFQVNPQLEGLIAAVPLHDLINIEQEKEAQATDNSMGGSPPDWTAEEIPF